MNRKTLHEYGTNFAEFLSIEDHEWIFTKGACHSFALELQEFLNRQGREAKLVYVASDGHEMIARHVLVQCGNNYWDVNGAHSQEEVTRDWAGNNISKLRQVGHVGWISAGSHTPETSVLGVYVEKSFLAESRLRARNFIETHSDKFK